MSVSFDPNCLFVRLSRSAISNEETGVDHGYWDRVLIGERRTHLELTSRARAEYVAGYLQAEECLADEEKTRK